MEAISVWYMLTYFQNYFNVELGIKFAAGPCYISHRILSVSLHCLVQYKRSKIAQLGHT